MDPTRLSLPPPSGPLPYTPGDSLGRLSNEQNVVKPPDEDLPALENVAAQLAEPTHTRRSSLSRFKPSEVVNATADDTSEAVASI